jgi:hypothetical protein
VKGDARWTMWLGIATALVLPACFYLGSRYGPVGIAAMWVLVYPVFTIPLYRRTFMRIEMRAADYLAVLWTPIRGTLLGGSSDGLRRFRRLAPGHPAWPLAPGALTYGVTTALPQRERLRKILAMLRKPAPGPATQNA